MMANGVFYDFDLCYVAVSSTFTFCVYVSISFVLSEINSDQCDIYRRNYIPILCIKNKIIDRMPKTKTRPLCNERTNSKKRENIVEFVLGMFNALKPIRWHRCTGWMGGMRMILFFIIIIILFRGEKVNLISYFIYKSCLWIIMGINLAFSLCIPIAAMPDSFISSRMSAGCFLLSV